MIPWTQKRIIGVSI
jgi:steroid 5-alpha reductase family enzyme